jgi:hypothetical protein
MSNLQEIVPAQGEREKARLRRLLAEDEANGKPSGRTGPEWLEGILKITDAHVWTDTEISALPLFGGFNGWFYGAVRDELGKIYVGEIFPGMGVSSADFDEENLEKIYQDLTELAPVSFFDPEERERRRKALTALVEKA